MMGDVLRTRATHAPHRANLRCLGLSVGIAIALSGCVPGYPSEKGYWHDFVYGNPSKQKDCT